MLSPKKKLSYYSIFTDEISEDNKNRILFSTRSSQAFVVNEKIYQALTNAQFQQIPKKFRQKLMNGQLLVDEAEQELQTIIAENNQQIDTNNVLYQVIQPSAMCQLGCDYCGQEHKKVNLSHPLADKLVERYRFKILSEPERYKTLYIGWFGGEPLMALQEIRLMTRRFQTLASELGLNYGAKMVTNGLSLKPKLFRELVKEYKINHFEITLDGVAEFHDSRRHTKEGHQTFDLIFENLKKIFALPDFRELNCTVSIRCNVDKRNYMGVSPLIKQMAAHQFQDFISHFYVASVYSWGNDAHLKSFSKEEFSEMEIDWLIEQFEHGFTPGLIPGRVKSVCLSVNPSNEMVDAYGNLFNCTEVSYVDVYQNTPYVLGNLKLDKTDSVYERPLANWNEEVLENKYQCHSCRMLPVCGGGCPKSWHEDMRACPTNKFNITEKLLLAYLQTKLEITEIKN